MSKNNTSDQNRRIESAIRNGIISAVDYTKRPPMVRVTSGGLESNWLKWCTPSAGKVKTWAPPSVGEGCLILSSSGETASGSVMTGFYTDDNPAPNQSPDEHSTHYPDGAIIKYNHATGTLSATGIKTATIQASTQMIATCPDIEMLGHVKIIGSLIVTDGVTSQGGLTVSGGTGASIKGNLDHSEGVITSTETVRDLHDHISGAPGQPTSKPR